MDCWTKYWPKGLLLVEYIHCGSVVYTKQGKRQEQTTHFISQKITDSAITMLDAAITMLDAAITMLDAAITMLDVANALDLELV